jgi:hypothetical protein
MDKDTWDNLALTIFASPLALSILAGIAIVWLKKTRPARKRMQAQITSSKISQGKFKGRNVREWITVGDYDVFVHKVTEHLCTEGDQSHRVIYADVEYRNTSGKENLSCRRNQWHLYAKDGYSYEAQSAMIAGNLYLQKQYFGGERVINPGMNVRGWFVFKVPENAEIVVLQFMTAFIGTKTADFTMENVIEKESFVQPINPTKRTVDERDVDPIEEMTRIARDILNLESRGFKETCRVAKPGELIYDSEWCRIKLIWGGWDYGGGNSVHIFYGRLHAASEKHTMLWNGEECHCWHDIDYQLHFLDGRSPAEAVELRHSHPVKKVFFEEELRKKYHRRQPDWLAEMHLAVWKHYGQRFFELFDLRRPELWEQYQQFLKEVYDIKGRSAAIKPPMDKVC